MKFDYEKSNLYKASNYGEVVDDSSAWQEGNFGLPKRITIRSWAIIDSVAFQYEGATLKCGGGGGTEKSFNLKENEYITEVTGDFKSFGDFKMLNSLIFKLNTGDTYGCNCGNGSDSFSFKAGNGSAICCFYGKGAEFVGGIGFYTTKINNLKKISIQGMQDNPFASISNLLKK